MVSIEVRAGAEDLSNGELQQTTIERSRSLEAEEEECQELEEKGDDEQPPLIGLEKRQSHALVDKEGEECQEESVGSAGALRKQGGLKAHAQ